MAANLKKPAKAREVVIAIIAMVVLFFFAYKNFFTKFKGEAQALEGQLKEMTDKIGSLEKLNSVLKERRAQALASDREDPAEIVNQDPRVQLIQRFRKQKYSDISVFFQDVTSSDFRASVSVDSVKYDPPQMNAGYFETKFSLAAHGDYTRVLEYLRKVEALPALLGVDNINMISDKSDPSVVALAISGTFYQLQEDDNA